MSNFTPTFRRLEDEYEDTQLVPVWDETKADDPSHEVIEDLVDDLPEQVSLKMRCATFEAVIDEVIEDFIEENDGAIESDRIIETVEPIVDKAVALHIVPSSMKQRVNYLIADKLKKRDDRIRLIQKTTRFIANAMVRMEDDPVIAEVLDDEPADIGVDITEDVVEHTGDSISVDGAVPTVVEQSLRFYTASTVNSKRAEAYMARYLSGNLLNSTLKQLKNHLPKSFKEKYRIK